MQQRRFNPDADALLSNGLLYLTLTAYSLTVYAIVLLFLLGLGLVPLKYLHGTSGIPWWVNIVVIGIVAPSLWPVRRWLQIRINDLICGLHDDPYALISKVNQQLQTQASPQLILTAIAETITRTLKLPYMAFEVYETDLHLSMGQAPARTELTTLPLTYLDKSLGNLLVAARRANETLSESDLNLLRDVAQYIGIALHAHQLTADLQASRERLVIAREEERRRIRNDLHDGLAPTLSSLQLQLGAMRALILQDPQQAETIADDLREDLRQATTEIRQLVYDLRPPMLDELGLVGAIKSFRLPETIVNFEVRVAEPLPKLSAAVEVAVYRVASEAIHNVIKHAQAATRCEVSLEVSNQQLTLSVKDNGQSLPAQINSGVGFQSMKERVAELGGTLSIQSAEAGGTCVLARLPIANNNG